MHGKTAPGLTFSPWPTHAQSLAIEGQKENGGTIYGSRRLLDVGNRRGDLNGDNVASLVWVPEFRYGLRILPSWPLLGNFELTILDDREHHCFRT